MMVRYVVVSLLLLLSGVGSAWATSPAEAFAEAHVAYDASEYEVAITLYERLLRDGFIAPEIYYNLANSRFRQGDHGQAILNLKRAQQLRPRDRDIQHNLYFILNEADAVYHVPPIWSRVLRQLTQQEWKGIAVGSWWILALFGGLQIVRFRNRVWLAPVAVSAIILLIALAGWWQWWSLGQRPEVVVIESGQDALFAPLPGSTAHFALPKGSVPRVDSVSDGWYRVRLGERDGWIRQSAVEPVRLAD